VTDQPTLVDVPATPRLTGQQQAAFDLITTRDGVTAAELGAHLHHLIGNHAEDRPCQWCEQRGRSVASSKALKPLVTYRKTSAGRVYVLRGPRAAVRPARGLIATSEPDVAKNPWADL
jgi:hypothetical protein